MSYCAGYCVNKYYVLGLGPPGALISVFPDGEIWLDWKKAPPGVLAPEWCLAGDLPQAVSTERTAEA